jgi:hypothetical protein
MRYTCPQCGAWVKDKFIFGLLHFCIPQPDDTIVRYQQQGQQATPEEFGEMLRTGITTAERRAAKAEK